MGSRSGSYLPPGREAEAANKKARAGIAKFAREAGMLEQNDQLVYDTTAENNAAPPAECRCDCLIQKGTCLHCEMCEFAH